MTGNSAILLLSLACAWNSTEAETPKPTPKFLAGTKPLTITGDIASQMVEGIDAFLLREIDQAAQHRQKVWKRDLSSAEAYNRSLEAPRRRLAHMLGVTEKRVAFSAPELVGTVQQSALVGQGKDYAVFAVRWPVIGEVYAEGLLLQPRDPRKRRNNYVVLPDADTLPEQICGLRPGIAPEMQYARHLAQSSHRVLVPVLIDRTYEARNGRAKMTNREFLYRSAFELGQHLIGYEVQKVLAALDWFAREDEENRTSTPRGVLGVGEGGMLALYAAALDPRIQTVGIAGYLGDRRKIWKEPLDRNVFGLLTEFADAELLAMIAPRKVLVQTEGAPRVKLPSEGGAPGEILPPTIEETATEIERAKQIMKEGKVLYSFELVNGSTKEQARAMLRGFEGTLDLNQELPSPLERGFDPQARQRRQFRQLERHTQQLLEESPYIRRDFMPIADQFSKPEDKKKLDTSSQAAYEKSIERYREYFATEVIGRFERKLLPANPRSRLYSESEKWIIYQVVLDVFPEVLAYGLLILPRDLKPGEKRPVVVCQHGLEGRPEDCIGDQQGYRSYKAFATKLAERGFITFAPQNPYIFRDRFRTLQRKANPLKKTLFSIIVPQHQQITDWLKTLPFVDGQRIGFYGLSYGGKTAMRVPPLVKNYCLSICSADFNDWVWKNASTRAPYSYVWTMEYEIFEFDLGRTFNYAEMAALIAPRPFMVERGHFDGVAPDERVALEYAKVRHLYQAKLGLGHRTEIEWFVGPHTIHGKGTFAFLHKHLNWPAPGEKK